MDTLTPVMATLGFGGVLGYCTGMFFKQTAKLMGCLLGLLFIIMQILAYYRIADWHWAILAKHASPAAQHAGEFFWRILRYNLPFTGGFGAGFWLGFRR